MIEKDENLLDPWSSILDDIEFDDPKPSPIKEEDDDIGFDLDDINDDNNDNNDDNDEGTVFTELVKTLKKKSVINIEDEDLKNIKTEEDFDSVIQKTVESKLEEELENWFSNSFDEETRNLVLELSKGAKLEDLLLQNKKSFDLNNEKEQEAAVRLWLKESGMDSEEIEDTIQLYKDSDTLDSKSKTAVLKLEKIQERKERERIANKQKEDAQKEQEKEEIINNIKEKIKISEEIKGYPLSEKDRTDLLNYIMVPSVKYKDPSTNKIINITKYQADEIERSKDMEVFLLKALQSMKGYDLTPIEKKGVTKNTKIIEEKYKKMIESDSQSKFKQTNYKQPKKDPFEEYLKKIK